MRWLNVTGAGDPRDTLIEAAVSTDGKPTITFHHFEQSELSTADDEQARVLMATGKHKMRRTEMVSAIGPNDIVTAIGGRNVDVLSIDIEGSQLAVLKGLFDAGLSPKFVCCETVCYDGGVTVSRDHAVADFFRDAGYVVVGDTVINTIFAQPTALDYRIA